MIERQATNPISDKIKIVAENEIKSEAIQDIIGIIPNKFIRFGSLAIFLVILLIIIGSNFISYPDILPAEIVITTTLPPVRIVSNSSGELQSIFVSNGQTVSKGESLAVIDNTAVYQDVLLLKKTLSNTHATDTINLAALTLGDISNSASQYFDCKRKLALFLDLNLRGKQKIALEKQISGYHRLKVEQLRQRELVKKEEELTKKDYLRNKKLFEAGVLSSLQFENEEKKFLLAQRESSSADQNVSTTNLSIVGLQKAISEIELAARDEQTRLEQAIDQSLKTLQSSILLWEEKYLVTSQINGVVSFIDHWSAGRYVLQSEPLFWIEPKVSNIIGKVRLSLHKSGKVRIGQEVEIKLDNFPFEEYGILVGRVRGISSLPNDKFYLIDVEFPNGLITSYKKELDFHQQMQGIASIVTEDLSLFERLFNQFRKLYNSR